MITTKRLWIRFSTVILLFLSLIACEFDPQGEHMVNIEIKEPGHISIDLNEAKDTIPLIANTTFSYSIDVDGREIKQLQVWLNDQLIKSTAGATGNFRLSPQNYTTGVYELRIDFTASSGTGSLADKVGAEVLKGERKWIIQIDIDPPHPVAILDIKPDKGSLLVSWENYDRINFRYYAIHKNNSYDPIVKIYDQKQLYFYDSLYMGGDVTYRVDIHGIDIQGHNRSARGETFSFSDIYPQIYEIANDKNSTFTFAWDKSKYYANFRSYTIYMNDGELIRVDQFININDTAITVSDVPFGNRVGIILYTSPQIHTSREYDHHAEITGVAVSTGQPYMGENMRYVPTNNSYYSYYDSIYRFAENDLATPVASISKPHDLSGSLGWFSISEDGQQAYLNEEGAILVLDPITLNVRRQINASEVIKNGASPGRLSVSNHHQLMFISSFISRGGNLWDSVYYVDLNTQPPNVTILGDFRAQGTISNSGKYIHTGQYILKITSTGFDTLGSLSLLSRKQFIGNQVEELLITESDHDNDKFTVSWMKLPDLQTTRSLTFTDINTYTITLDLENNYLGGKSSIDERQYLIYDLNTGLLLKTIRIAKSPQRLYLQNKILFSSSGSYMAIDDL